MPQATKKWVLVLIAPAAAVISASAETYNGTARTATALTGAVSTLTSAALFAAKMPASSYLATAANIEGYGIATTAGGNSVIAIQTKAIPLASTLTALSITAGGTVYTASVADHEAFADSGLTADAELAAMVNFSSALSAALV